MNKSSLYFAVLFILLLTAGISYGWVTGQNRILNSTFEDDTVGQPPMNWGVAKGG